MMLKRREETPAVSNMPMNLIRDCASEYASCWKLCLESDHWWEFLNIFPEYIADIAQKQPDFAFQLLTCEQRDHYGWR